jgi:hypothetical protein
MRFRTLQHFFGKIFEKKHFKKYEPIQKFPLKKRLFLLILENSPLFSQFFHETGFYSVFLVILAIIFNFCRIQLILVKHDIFGTFLCNLADSDYFGDCFRIQSISAINGYFCKIRQIFDYFFDFCQIRSFSKTGGQFFWAGNVLLKS